MPSLGVAGRPTSRDAPACPVRSSTSFSARTIGVQTGPWSSPATFHRCRQPTPSRRWIGSPAVGMPPSSVRATTVDIISWRCAGRHHPVGGRGPFVGDDGIVSRPGSSRPSPARWGARLHSMAPIAVSRQRAGPVTIWRHGPTSIRSMICTRWRLSSNMTGSSPHTRRPGSPAGRNWAITGSARHTTRSRIQVTGSRAALAPRG